MPLRRREERVRIRIRYRNTLLKVIKSVPRLCVVLIIVCSILSTILSAAYALPAVIIQFSAIIVAMIFALIQAYIRKLGIPYVVSSTFTGRELIIKFSTPVTIPMILAQESDTLTLDVSDIPTSLMVYRGRYIGRIVIDRYDNLIEIEYEIQR